MKCKFCQQPVKLVPSARSRAKKFGGRPSDYTKLFPAHTQCVLDNATLTLNRLLRSLNQAA